MWHASDGAIMATDCFDQPQRVDPDTAEEEGVLHTEESPLPSAETLASPGV